MSGRLPTIWLVYLAILVCVVTILVTTQTKAFSARHLPDVPAPIAEFIEYGDSEEVRLEYVTPALSPFSRHTMAPVHNGLVVLQLSPVIFRPPEAA